MRKLLRRVWRKWEWILGRSWGMPFWPEACWCETREQLDRWNDDRAEFEDFWTGY